LPVAPCEITRRCRPGVGCDAQSGAGLARVWQQPVWAFSQTSSINLLEVTIVPNPSIKNEKMYRDLRKQGNSEEKAARISNAAASRGKSSVGRKGGKAGSYADWTVAELKKRAKELGISGYSGLTKDKLVAKLRNH
jgi:hypothetical protein